MKTTAEEDVQSRHYIDEGFSELPNNIWDYNAD
jgi:hypothetical protein